MSSFFTDIKPSFVEKIIVKLFCQGKIPAHIGFILDGNRRYARQQQIKTKVGHVHGYAKLGHIFAWCRILGVRQTTVYAFSIENFKRSPGEVTDLMNLFRRMFREIIEEASKPDCLHICVRVFGKLDLLPADLQKSIAKAVKITSMYDSFVLNVALAYTSREEICTSITAIKDRVKNGQLEVEKITEKTLNDSMYSVGLDDPDILIRTSGEIRLSDFLLWQTSFSYIFYVKEEWPTFSVWSLIVSILHFQVKEDDIKQAKKCFDDQMRLLQSHQN